jgi:hypothetical protein
LADSAAVIVRPILRGFLMGVVLLMQGCALFEVPKDGAKKMQQAEQDAKYEQEVQSRESFYRNLGFKGEAARAKAAQDVRTGIGR